MLPITLKNPAQFDAYLFSGWNPTISGIFEQFHIVKISDYKSHLHLPVPPHRRAVFLFVYVTKGWAIRSKGLNTYRIEANQVFFLPADQITSLDEISSDIEGYYCHFQPSLFVESGIKFDSISAWPFFSRDGNPIISLGEPERIQPILDILLGEYLQNDPSRKSIIPYYLQVLFAEFKFSIPHADTPARRFSEALTQRYQESLSQHLSRFHSVEAFADFLQVSPNHLNKVVKASTGKSAQQLLIEMRLLEAKVLLKQSDLSMSEITERIGKNDSSDFSRFFKLHEKITPLAYRMQK